MIRSMALALSLLCSVTNAQLAKAQPANAPARSPTTRLIILGTQGGPRGTAERAQPSNVLIVNDTPYLIDAGNGVVRQLFLAGVPFTSIRHIFITHNHDYYGMAAGTAYLRIEHDAHWLSPLRQSPVR